MYGYYMILLPCLCVTVSFQTRVDQTLLPDTHGQEVVSATIKKLQDSCIFSNDHQFLTRLAWVQSEFGDAAGTFNTNEGIWALLQSNFETTLNPKKYSSDTKWQSFVDEIEGRLKVNYPNIKYEKGDLKIPFNAAIATRFFIESLQDDIPFYVKDQAKLYDDYMSTRATNKSFEDLVNKMKPNCLSAGADILFMLDSSGSICEGQPSVGGRKGCENYVNMVDLAKGLIKNLPYDSVNAYQYAIDVFSNTVTHSISFNSYNSTGQLLDLIDQKVKYIGYGTRTDLALDEAVVKTFTEQYGVRDIALGFPRVVILLTDGESNEPGKTKISAEVAKQNGLVLFTVGIGNAFHGQAGKKELNYIALFPKCMHMYLVKDFKALLFGFNEEIKSQTCYVSALPKSNQTEFSGPLPQNSTKYFEVKANVSNGITFNFAVEGSAVMYISTTQNPDEVIYDYKLEAETGKPSYLYLSSEDLEKLGKSSAFFMQFAAEEDALLLYSTIKGLDPANNFTLDFEKGLVTSTTTRTTIKTAITTPKGQAMALLANKILIFSTICLFALRFS